MLQVFIVTFKLIGFYSPDTALVIDADTGGEAGGIPPGSVNLFVFDTAADPSGDDPPGDEEPPADDGGDDGDDTGDTIDDDAADDGRGEGDDAAGDGASGDGSSGGCFVTGL